MNKKQFFFLFKRGFYFGYGSALLSTIAAIFIYSHINQLRPGAQLMLFSLRFFTMSLFLFWLLFFLLFYLNQYLKNQKETKEQSF